MGCEQNGNRAAIFVDPVNGIMADPVWNSDLFRAAFPYMEIGQRTISIGGIEIPRWRADGKALLLLARESLHGRLTTDKTLGELVVDGGCDRSYGRQLVRTLRRRLKEDPRNPTYIRTVLHRGYLLKREDRTI